MTSIFGMYKQRQSHSVFTLHSNVALMSGIIAVITAILIAVVIYMVVKPKSYYSHNHPILNKVRSNFKILDTRYEKIPLRQGDSAYTEDKAVITLCLVKPGTQEYYDINTIMYVALHELAHVISKGHGHGEEFETNFAKLIRDAAEKGIYDPRKPIPDTYCGIGPDD